MFTYPADRFEEALASAHANVVFPRLSVATPLCRNEVVRCRFGNVAMRDTVVS